jgi:cytoskeletal protein CcmA (bactofilin family)
VLEQLREGRHRKRISAQLIFKDNAMLDSLRKKDTSRPGYNPPPSPFSKMQEALSPTSPAPATAETKPEAKDEIMETRPANNENSGGSKLIVGPDIKLKGAEITDCDTLVVEGRVEASMDSRAIQIAEKGVFVGTCGVDVAEIRGSFEGELTVRKQLVIRSTGRISGKIRYGKVAIEEGGELSGDIAAITSDKSSGSSDAWKNASSDNRAMPLPKVAAR